MIIKDENLQNYLFGNLQTENYKNYIEQHKLHKILDINLRDYGEVNKKQIKSPNYSVDPKLTEIFPAELNNLCRLHFLIISRKAITILEYGLGKSTAVFNDTLKKIKQIMKST